jgi:hypothetical protein
MSIQLPPHAPVYAAIIDEELAPPTPHAMYAPLDEHP